MSTNGSDTGVNSAVDEENSHFENIIRYTSIRDWPTWLECFPIRHGIIRVINVLLSHQGFGRGLNKMDYEQFQSGRAALLMLSTPEDIRRVCIRIMKYKRQLSNYKIVYPKILFVGFPIGGVAAC